MLQAKIFGNATSILKHESLDGKKLLLAVAIEPNGKPYGDPMIVLDYLGAGPGDVVLITSDGSYTGGTIVGTRKTPARWGVVGIIDPARKAEDGRASDDEMGNIGDIIAG